MVSTVSFCAFHKDMVFCKVLYCQAYCVSETWSHPQALICKIVFKKQVNKGGSISFSFLVLPLQLLLTVILIHMLLL